MADTSRLQIRGTAMMRPPRALAGLEITLPLLITGLLVLVSGGFSWQAYTQVRDVTLAAAGQHLERVMAQLAASLKAGGPQRSAEVRQLADQPAVRAYLAGPGGPVRAARSTLEGLTARDSLAPAGERTAAGRERPPGGDRVHATRPRDVPRSRPSDRWHAMDPGGGAAARPCPRPGAELRRAHGRGGAGAHRGGRRWSVGGEPPGAAAAPARRPPATPGRDPVPVGGRVGAERDGDDRSRRHDHAGESGGRAAVRLHARGDAGPAHRAPGPRAVPPRASRVSDRLLRQPANPGHGRGAGVVRAPQGRRRGPRRDRAEPHRER